MSLMSIGSVSKTAEVRPSAIRYYESLGLLPAPERKSGKRRYSPDAVTRLRAIRLFKEAGFTMDELQLLLRTEPRPNLGLVEELTVRKLRELDLLIDKVQAMKAVLESVRLCGCLTLEDCALLG